jgi:hypothetical protein
VSSAVWPRRRRTAGLVVVLLTVSVGVPAALAGGGGPCQYASDPANSQHRGQQVTVTGTFGEQHQNGVIQVLLRSGANDYPLSPPTDTADGSGAFDHTATIPVSTPIGDYALITIGPGPPDNPVFCSKPFSVTQGGGFATPTTQPPATTTTAPPTTTTTLAPATTVASTTTTTALDTTTLPDDTTTTIDDLIAGDDTSGGSGAPWWLILAALLALVVALVGFFLGRRRSEEPPPPA